MSCVLALYDFPGGTGRQPGIATSQGIYEEIYELVIFRGPEAKVSLIKFLRFPLSPPPHSHPCLWFVY